MNTIYIYNNNNKLQLGCHPVAGIVLHVYKIRNWLLINSIFNISHNSSWNEKRFRQTCRENQNTHFMFKNIFPEVVPFIR